MKPKACGTDRLALLRNYSVERLPSRATLTFSCKRSSKARSTTRFCTAAITIHACRHCSLPSVHLFAVQIQKCPVAAVSEYGLCFGSLPLQNLRLLGAFHYHSIGCRCSEFVAKLYEVLPALCIDQTTCPFHRLSLADASDCLILPLKLWIARQDRIWHQIDAQQRRPERALGTICPSARRDPPSDRRSK